MSPAGPRQRSTFYLAMRLMPAHRRRAMFAIYDLARAIDEVVDGDAPEAAKRAELESWRREIAALYDGAPTHELTTALQPALAEFRLPRREFEQLLAGFAMDIDGHARAPTQAAFDLYCRRVAGAVGVLSLPVFGADGPAEHEFALHLARALQITNILRDIDQDAQIGRLYMPREYLAAAGLDANAEIATLIGDARFADALARLRADAHAAFAAVDATLPRCRRSTLWPALGMMAAYRSILRDLERGRNRTRLVRARALAAAIGAMLIGRLA